MSSNSDSVDDAPPQAGPDLRSLPSVKFAETGRLIYCSLDLASTSLVEGWAFDPSHPDEPVKLVAYIGDEIVWSGEADRLREDLRGAGLGSGRCAFSVDFSARVSPSAAPLLSVSVKIAEFDADLPGSPATVVPRDVLRRTPEIAGHLDAVDAAHIRGWALDRSAPHLPVSLDIMDANRVITRIVADRYRADLEREGIGNGFHAFTLPTPAALFDGAVHLLRAVVSNTTHQIVNSPQKVQFDVSAAQHMSAEFAHTIHASIQALVNLEKIAEGVSNGLMVRNSRDVVIYNEWRRNFARIDAKARAALIDHATSLRDPPLFSVIMPTHNTPAIMLEAAVASVVGQLYAHWELCIADDASDEGTRNLIVTLTRQDPRIKTVFMPERVGIAATTNAAMALAAGDYVSFLDHDDLLTEDALLQFALVAARDQPAIIYSDEDKLDSAGNFFAPHFKPEYNYSLLLAYNYLCHFVAVKRALAEEVGPLRSAFDGSQDHDFLLRCCERIEPSAIRHVPFVLYHWRSHAESTAQNSDSKRYAGDAGVRVVADHLRRTGQDATVSRGAHGSYRVKWRLPAKPPLVSILVPTRDQSEILAKCIDSILNLTRYSAYEIVVVDNQSIEPATLRLFDRILENERIRIVPFDQEFNFSAICNHSARQTDGDLVLMLNNDIEVLEPDWLEEMVSQCLRPGIGAVGARLLYPDGRLQHAGVILGIGGIAGHSHKYIRADEIGYMNRPNIVQELSACTAACLLLRREAFETVGGFDECHLPVAFNDVDLCLRLGEAGYRIVYTPHATLRHHESLSRGDDETDVVKLARATREKERMFARWGAALQSDPAYSPNLTLVREDFSIDPQRGASRLLLTEAEPPR